MTANTQNRGELTYREIAEQPLALKEAYEEALRRKAWAETYLAEPTVSQTLFVGSGSSYYQSQTMAATYRSWLGREALALPSSDLLLIRKQVASEKLRTVVFGISRSGESTEVVKALESVKELPNWQTAGVTCYKDSSMASLGDVLVSKLGQEQSTVMTKSLASMIVGVQTAIASVSDQPSLLTDMADVVAGQADRVIEGEQLAKDLVQSRHFDRTVFLGLGAMFGIAQEGCLKLKEMANVWTESFGTLEFRHGPKSIVDPHTCVIVLVTESSRAAELKVAQEMKEYGAHVVVVVAAAGEDTAFADTVVVVGLSHVADEARSVAALPFLQYYGYFTALKRGVDPDQPRNLTQVVRI
ncbi:SIS domain-containing protein [Cohnella endophytica]|uniref:SIS domain-containing protein n=1 Tax=Cohnella endophytica TaxID=2419778 RepID=A0A494XJM3_9BACL|nr:SIS domain-containing protein [Cohnella endophytica]RKP49911.1 SIS domain-containing protein [Cohnella endophytica]